MAADGRSQRRGARNLLEGVYPRLSRLMAGAGSALLGLGLAGCFGPQPTVSATP
jgi:hypothetical protein